MALNEKLVQYIFDHETLFDKFDYHFYEDIRFFMTKKFLEEEQRIRNFVVYEDDVWVLTYLKCGTTWSMEMVWLIGNNLDYKGAETLLDERFPFLEISLLLMSNKTVAEGFKNTGAEDTIKLAEQTPRPRFIKCHLPVDLLPKQLFEKKPKIIFVLREPKDVAVSYLNHFRLFFGYHGSSDKFYEAFMEGCIPWGSYWHYVAPFWKIRHENPNMLILTYEEMKKDLASVIQRTASFLGKTINEKDLPGLLDHLSFNKMKVNDSLNFSVMTAIFKSIDSKNQYEGAFMRKGEIGDYKNSMSEEIMKKFDQHHAEMKQKFGLEDFPY